MNSPQWQTNQEDAENYFEPHMRAANYHAGGCEFPGRWFGKGAGRLGLQGTVEKVHFERLCRNQDPQTGHRLTERQKADRRIFWDLTYSPPKSVSVLALVGRDERITAAHREAAWHSVHALEKFAMCRGHENGGSGDRETSNIVGALFTEALSRASDPHLHDHALHFNVTHDKVTGRWRALQNSEMLRANKFAEALYYHHLAQSLLRLGYELRPVHGRSDFEVVGIDDTIIDQFSKRHQQIQNAASELTKAKGGNIKNHAEMIAHKVREPKLKGVTQEELVERWRNELTPYQNAQIDLVIQKAKAQPLSPPKVISASAAIDWALRHVLERRAVVREHEIIRYALDFARGSNITVDQIQQALAERRDVLRAERNITTIEVLVTETKLLEIAQEGRGKCAPMHPRWEADAKLNAEQAGALLGILRQTDEHCILRGGAGTGKSTLLREVSRALENSGHPLVVLAPQAQQVRGLAKDGLPAPQTLAAVLKADSLPENAIVLCDEAGMIGSVSLLKLFRLCRRHHCRLVLSGDTRQLGSVERGDAMRSLEKYAGLNTFELTEVQRQNPALGTTVSEKKLIQTHKQSVVAAAQGQIAKSLDLLDQAGAIREVETDKLGEMADAYLEITKKGESILAVSQTRADVGRLNEEIRRRLQEEGVIGNEQITMDALVCRDYTEAQKQDPRSYTSGATLMLHGNLNAWKAGQTLRVIKVTEQGLTVGSGRSQDTLPWNTSDKWQVFDWKKINVARGDQLQLKRNTRSPKGLNSFVNGEIVHVANVLKDGSILLKDGRRLSEEYRSFQYGYATTSYSGQGRTVDHVLVADSGVRAATNAREWYVDISRGRKSVTIFTENKLDLKRRVSESGNSQLAMEVFSQNEDAPKMRAGLRSRHTLRQMAAAAVKRAKSFVIQCCNQMQVVRRLEALRQTTRHSIRKAPALSR